MTKDFTDNLINEYLKSSKLDTVLKEDRQMSLFDIDEEGNLVPTRAFDDTNFDGKQINYLAYEDFQEKLKECSVKGNKTVETKYLLEFMQSLTGKLLQKNHLLQLQYLINGFNFELPVWLANPELEFISNDHWGIKRGDHGEQKPDFKFTFNDVEYTIDTKTYKTIESMKNANTYDFHNTKFIIAACLDDGKYYYRVKIDGQNGVYTNPVLLSELPELAQMIIGWINLPKEITMLYFYGIKDLTDADLESIPEVKFGFRNYTLSK